MVVNWDKIEVYIDEVKNPKGKILFLHGFTGNFNNKISFRHFFKDYSFYGINLPGHGNSVCDDLKSLHTKVFFEVIVAFIEKYHLTDLIILGHSMGGGLAVILANYLKTKIKCLILEAPANKEVFKNYETIIKKLIPGSIEEAKMIVSKLIYDPLKFFGSQKRWEWFVNNEYKNLSTKYFNLKILLEFDLMKLFFNEIQKAISQIKLPILLILGDQDEIVPWKETMDNFLQTLPDKNQLEVIVAKNSAHLPLSENKQLLVDVECFLSKIINN